MGIHGSSRIGGVWTRGLMGTAVCSVAGLLGAANLTWQGSAGADWMTAGAWLDGSSNYVTWNMGDNPTFPSGASVAVSNRLQLGDDGDSLVVFQGGNVSISGNGSISAKSKKIYLNGAAVNSMVSWDLLYTGSLEVYGPGSFRAASGAASCAYFDLKDGSALVFDAVSGDMPTVSFYGYEAMNLVDIGGGTSRNFPNFYGWGTTRNFKSSAAGDRNVVTTDAGKHIEWVLDTGTDIVNRDRIQLNNASVLIKEGAKLDAGMTTGAAYGIFVGLDCDNAVSELTVEGGELLVNVEGMGTLAGGLGIGCMGGSQYNTTGTVLLKGGTTRVATVMMTSSWQPLLQAQGWHSGGRGSFTHQGGAFETWKIFAGNTTSEGSNNSQEWHFTGCTGTIGSIRQGQWAKVDFTMDGYTVKAYEDTPAWFLSDGAPLETQTYRIGSNGLTFDTNGKTVGINLSTWDKQGPLTKIGAGVLKLTGDWLGQPITVNAGSLGFGGTAVQVGPLTVAAGAALEVVATADGIFPLTAASVNLADGATIKLSGFPPSSGTYPILHTDALTANLDNLAFDAQGLETGTAALVAIEDGLAVQINSYAAMDLTYRGASTSSLWNLADPNWITSQGVASVWVPNSSAIFDGQAAAGITVTENVIVKDMTFNGSSDFSLLGTGTLEGTGTLIKNGTGTLVLDGPALTQQTIEIRNGVVKLGANASPQALGPEDPVTHAGGVVNILAGGTFNGNYDQVAGGTDSVRAYITQCKTFRIAGDGVDGRGALVNDSDSIAEGDRQNCWNSMLRRVELTDNATVGGNTRMDVRKHSNQGTTSVPGVFGPDYRLTVKATAPFGLVGVPIDIGSILVTGGGIFRPEDVSGDQLKIPGGITLDNGTIHAYSIGFQASTAIEVTANGGTIQAENGTNTFPGPTKVAANGTLALTGGAQDNYTGGIENNGGVVARGGNHLFLAGAIAGSGTWAVDGGHLAWSAALDLGAPRTVNLMNGTFSYGWETDSAAKLNQKVTVNTVNDASGIVRFNTGASGTITGNDITISGRPYQAVFCTNPNDQNVTARYESMSVSVSQFMCWGKDSTGANVVYGPGVALNTYEAYFGDSTSDAKSIVTFEEGSSLTVDNHCMVGNLESATEERRVIVDGGTVRVTSGRLIMGQYGKYALMDLKRGLVDVKGLQCRWGATDPRDHFEQFTMDGGTLRIGGGGLHAWTHFNPFVQLNNGNFECSEDWVVERMCAVGFGDKVGGHVKFDLNGKNIEWRTGLTGLADVTLTGGGNLVTGTTTEDPGQYMQGVLGGKWTIENAGTSDLSGASAFGGGLELAENVAATIDIGGETLIQAFHMRYGTDSLNTFQVCSNGYPYACNNLTFLHSTGPENYHNDVVLMWQGQFYVDTPGIWTFAAGYDDAALVDIDGENVVFSGTWNAVVSGQKELTIGWHDFRIGLSQNAGGYGSVPDGWANVMNVGFAKRAVSGTNASDYQRFDGEHLPIRGVPAASVGGTVNWHGVASSSDWQTRTDWTWNDTFKELSKLHVYNVPLKYSMAGSTHLFDGWVFIKATQAGDWQVHLDYDDGCTLAIDDVDSGADGTNVKDSTLAGITTGWHRFALRTMDSGGNWGPWGDAKNFARITVNGRSFNFDETGFFFSTTPPVEYAGLYGTTTLQEGSRLVNKAGTSCPIWGTIAGSGTFAGPYAFAGDKGCLKVTGEGDVSEVAVPKFEDGDDNALQKLRRVEVAFVKRPVFAFYDLGRAYGADPAQIELSVKHGEDEDDTDKFALILTGGRLKLRNASLNGTIFFIR